MTDRPPSSPSDSHRAAAIPDDDGATRDSGVSRYAIAVALDGIDFRPAALTGPVPLGRQILAAAGLRPVDNFALFALLGDGGFEDVRLDEPFDMRARGIERFIAFSGSDLHRFVIDALPFAWGPSGIAEDAVRLLGRASDDDAIFLEVRGGTDRLIAAGEVVDLTRPGVERFITAPGPVTYRFFVDGTRFQTEQRLLTGAQIKAMVDGWNAEHELMLEGHGDDPDRLIGDDEQVDLATDHGPRRFSSVPKANFG